MSKTCSNCGAEVSEGASVCDNCGMPVSEAPPEAPAQQDPATLPAPPPSQPSSLPPPPQPESPSLPPPPAVKPPPIYVPPPPERGGRSRRGLWILSGGFVAALLLIGGAVWALASYFQEGNGAAPEPAALPEAAEEVVADEGPPAEEGPEPASSDFQIVEHESGNFSVEVPSGWQDIYTGYDGTFEGKDVDAGEGVGPAITATADMNAWSTGGYAPGVFAVASRELAEEYGEEGLAVSGFNDRSPCEAGDSQDFDRPPYSGRIQSWDCPDDGSTFFTLGAATEDRGCAVMMQVRAYSEADREDARRILDTFEADCGGTAPY